MPDVVPKSKRLLGRLAVLVLTLLLALGAGEVAVRIFLPTPRYPYINFPNEKVGYVMQPGFVGRGANHLADWDSAIHINQEGFRDADHPVAKPANTIRIAFLGDSFTYAEQVEEADCFARRSETLLNQGRTASRPRVEVMNFGIGGWDLPQYIQCYEHFVRKYHPDIVVVAVYVDNDLLNCVIHQLEPNLGGPYFRLKDNAVEEVPADMGKLQAHYEKYTRRFALKWYHHSHLYNRQKIVLWNLRQQRNLAKAQKQNRDLPLDKLWKQSGYRNYRYYAQGINDPLVAAADAVARLLLQRLKRDVEADGAKLLVALLPAPENLAPEIWPERVKSLPGLEKITMDFERPFTEVAAALPELAKRGDILDTRPALRHGAKGGPVFFPVDCHYTLRGQTAVGDALAEWLEPRMPSK